jgi:hypothetical protein
MNSTNLIEDFRLLAPPSYGTWLVLLLVALLLVGLSLLPRLRFRRPQALVGQPSPSPEPWAEALADLERLAALLSSEHGREYAVRSSRILRRYIEKRYSLRAPRLATEEFLAMAGESSALPPPQRAGLRTFLEHCDLLKFGRYVALEKELETLHSGAVDFVLASRPAAVPEKAANP